MNAIKTFCVIQLLVSSAAFAAEPSIHFDMAPVSVAREGSADNGNLVTIDLKLSSMIAAPNLPRIDQWIVQCQPRNAELQVKDYASRTEVGSDIAGPVQVKRTNERSSSAGTFSASPSTQHRKPTLDPRYKSVWPVRNWQVA